MDQLKKLFFLIICTCLLGTSLLAQTIKLDFKGQPLKTILKSIEKQTNYTFVYSSALVGINQNATITAIDEKLDPVLGRLFENSNIVYKIVDSQIILSSSDLVKVDQQIVQPQKNGTFSLKGKISDKSSGEPISFATIFIKENKNNGVSSDLDGNYAINAAIGQTLVVSYIGYKTTEFLIDGKAVLNIGLDLESTSLNEVMIVAYGTAKKGTFTGAASVIKSDAIKDVASMSFESALTGKVAGLQFSPGSGQVGAVSSIRIRGTGSINASNEPLYVVDGVPVLSGDVSQLGSVSGSGVAVNSNNIMATINPNDIESITVLKDAAASSLYGSRAANGVIVITTKKGKLGRPVVTFRATVGITPNYAYNNFETVTPEQNERLVYETFYNWRLDLGDSESEADAYAKKEGLDLYIPKDPRGYYDWEKALFRTGVTQNYDVSLTGGNDQTKYYVSAAYTNDKGRVQQNKMDRYNARVNLTQKVGNFVEVGANVNVSSMTKYGFDDSRSYGYNYFYMVRNLLHPNYFPTDLNGNPVTTRYMSYVYNMEYYQNLESRKSNTFRMSGIGHVAVDILPVLKFRSVINYDYTRVDDNSYISPNHFNATSTKGATSMYASKFEKLVSSSTLTFDKTFASKHNVNILAGWEVESNKAQYQSASGTKLPNATNESVSAAGSTTGTGYNTKDNLMSFLSKLDYNYDNKYYLSGSYRMDGSSRFGENSRWGNFWSVAGSWRIKEENWLKNVNWLSNLRLRASYGVNGTMPTSLYSHQSLFGYSGGNIGGLPGGMVSNVADPNLTWETNYTWNLAIESSFFDGRLNFNAEVYNRDSKNLLQPVGISHITGFSSILTNFGEMNNKGVEFEVSGDIIRSKSWVWDMGINASTYKSKITKLYDGADIINGVFIYREGYSPNSFYGQEWAGVDPSNGYPRYFLNNGTQPGDAGTQTLDGRTITNDRTKASSVIIGKYDPKLYGGINTSVVFKSMLSLSMSFSYSLGGSSFDDTAKDNQDDGYYSARVMSRLQWNRWQKPGDITDVPRRSFTEIQSGQGYQSRKVHSTDHIRLKNITLSYNLNQNLLNKIHMSSARIYFTGTNLLTWARYKEYDPEVPVRGVRGWELPIGKTYTFGIEFSF